MKNVFLLLVAALMLCSVFDGEAAPWGDNSVLPEDNDRGKRQLDPLGGAYIPLGRDKPKGSKGRKMKRGTDNFEDEFHDFDTLGGGEIPLRRELDSFGGGEIPLRRDLDTFGGGEIPLRRGLDEFGGGEIPLRRGLDTFGGGEIPLRRDLETFGGGEIPLRREANPYRKTLQAWNFEKKVYAAKERANRKHKREIVGGEIPMESFVPAAEVEPIGEFDKKNFDSIDQSTFGFKRNFDSIDQTTFGMKRNFDSIDQSTFGFRRKRDFGNAKPAGELDKKNFDSIDQSTFGMKRNFDSIDQSTFGMKRNFDSIDQSTFGMKRNFDSIDQSTFGMKRNFDSIDQSTFGMKRNFDSIDQSTFGMKRNFDSIDQSTFGFRRKRNTGSSNGDHIAAASPVESPPAVTGDEKTFDEVVSSEGVHEPAANETRPLSSASANHNQLDLVSGSSTTGDSKNDNKDNNNNNKRGNGKRMAENRANFDSIEHQSSFNDFDVSVTLDRMHNVTTEGQPINPV